MSDFNFSMQLWKAADGEMRFRGIASTLGLDRQGPGWEMLPEALDMMEQFTNVPLLNWADGSHNADRSRAIGKAERFWREGDKVWTEGVLYDWVPEAHTIYDQLGDLEKGGECAYALSVGGSLDFGTDETGKRGIAGVHLTNLVVGSPDNVMNPGCLMGLAKALEPEEELEKALLPLAPENLGWDAARAKAALKEYAGGEGEDGELDWGKYGRGFFWHAPSPDKQEDFKLPFATISDGEPVAVWNGIAAAYAAMQGARGGVDIPEADRAAVLDKIKAYYAAFDKPWPKERRKAAENLEAELEKAGARQTAQEYEMIHAIVEKAIALCGCDKCLGWSGKGELHKSEEVVEMNETEDILTEETAEVSEETTETTTASVEPEAEVKETSAAETEAVEETEGETETEPLDKAASLEEALAKALEPVQAVLTETQAALAKAEERIKELEGRPVAGGPVSTAQTETEDRTAAPALEKADPVKAALERGDKDAARRLSAARAMGVPL